MAPQRRDERELIDPKWFESVANVVNLSESLYRDGKLTIDELFFVLRNPWKYDKQWKEYLKATGRMA